MNVPDIDVEATDGSFNPSEAEKAVVYFYPKDDTPGCTKEACGFQDVLGDIGEHGFSLYGVSNDPIESHERFREKYDLSFPLVADTDASLSKAFDVYEEQSFDGETFMGITRSTFIIVEGEVVASFRGVDPDGHWNDVLDWLAGYDG